MKGKHKKESPWDKIKKQLKIGQIVLSHLTHRHDGTTEGARRAKVVEKCGNHVLLQFAETKEPIRVPYNAIVDMMEELNLNISMQQLQQKYTG